MNRRNFLKRSAAIASVAAVSVIPTTEVVVRERFPETLEEMSALVEDAKKSGKFRWRREGEYILEGLSRTDTYASTHWYYHKGDRHAVLHVRESDNHICFYINFADESMKTQWLPPYRR